MFLGVDHGTMAIRFAASGNGFWELPRERAAGLTPQEILQLLEENLGLREVELVALTYSMGDGLSRIVRMEDAPNRGLLQQDGAGLHLGGGTRVFEAMRASGWPAVLLPGIGRKSDIDPRMRVFSHGMSPEKVGLAYGVFRKGIRDFIISDASSNTVTFGVRKGRIVGAIDAPIFAPGLIQGPLDVEAIRRVDAGLSTANKAFTEGGILSKAGRHRLEECTSSERELALETLALFASMEISAMSVLMRDLGSPAPALYLAGSPAQLITGRVSQLLGREVRALGTFAAARGCAWIAEDIYNGEDCILGLEADETIRSQEKRRPSEDERS
jgi:putative methanogenesis marker protein 12